MRPVTLALILAGTVASPTLAQTGIRIDSLCRECQIAITRVMLIEGEDGSLSGYPPSVLRRSDGTVILIDQVERLPFLFDARGKFVRKLGRKGAGPGEFMYARLVVGTGDGGVEVLDPRLNRRTVLNAEGEISTVPFPGHGPSLGAAVSAPGGGLITNRILLDAEGAGIPLQEYDAAGNLISRFGKTMVFSAAESWRMDRELFRCQDGTLLVLQPYAHIVFEYSPDRTLVREYSRIAPWLKQLDPTSEPSGGHGEREPSTIGKAIWQEPAGVTWIATLVPSPAWKPTATGGTPAAPQDRFHTVVEAVDLRSHRLLAVDTLPRMVSGLASVGHLASYSERVDGSPYVELWRITLASRE